MNGRNFLDLALLAPGVAPTNIASTQLFPETSAVPGITISVGSQRNLSNNFVVDGLSANDDAAGLSGITYGVDAIEQFQVITSGAQAELGRALGGYVNVVTKSGTNDLRGTVYDFFRDDSLNATQRAVRHEAADEPVAVRRAASAARSQRTARSSSATSSGAISIRPGLTTISDAECGRDQRPSRRHRLPRAADHHRHLSESRVDDQRRSPRSIISSAAAISSASATAAMASPRPTRAAPAA